MRPLYSAQGVHVTTESGPHDTASARPLSFSRRSSCWCCFWPSSSPGPFLRPFAFAVILAVVFQPLHERVLRLTKQRHAWGALISTLGVSLLFGVPAFIITTLAANEALSAAHYLSRRSAEEGGVHHFRHHPGGQAASLYRALGGSFEVRFQGHDQLQRPEVESRHVRIRCGCSWQSGADSPSIADHLRDPVLSVSRGQGLGLSCRQADAAFAGASGAALSRTSPTPSSPTFTAS